MAIYCPTKYYKDFKNYNDELKLIKGEMDDKQAKISLAKFLRQNIGFTCELISGFRPAMYQEMMLKAMFNRNFSMFVAARGASKTLYYDDSINLVEKTLGLSSIKEIFKDVNFNGEDRWENVESRLLWNGNDYKLVDKIYIQPNKQCIKITTYNGYELIGSKNHLIKGLNYDSFNCGIEWKRFHELKIDDYVGISRNEVNFGNNIGIEDADIAYLIGLLIGDGCYSPNTYPKNNLSITSGDDEILNFCLKYTKLTVQNKKGSIAKMIRFPQEFSKKLFEDYHIKPSLSYYKVIPSKILQSKFLLKECLSGLFDTDGGASNHGVKFSSTSKILINQVQQSLLLFGVVSKIKERKTPSPFGRSWDIIIYGENISKFNQHIGFRLSRKKNLAEGMVKEYFNTNKDIIPNAMEICVKIIEDSKTIFNKSVFKQYKIPYKPFNRKNISYMTLNNFLKFFNDFSITDDRIKQLLEISNERFFFDKIKSIEYFNYDCIDLNVPDGECYWANGFINHNSTMAALACFLLPIFNPGINILLAGPTFRSARHIFTTLEKIVKSPEAQILQECFCETASRRADLFEWNINGGSIRAIPLNGEKIRGFRANTLILDEFLLLSEDIVNNVLMPFLIAPSDIKKRMEIVEREDKLVLEGKITNEQRTQFPNSSRMIALTSASYTFENAYKVYSDWHNKIMSDEPIKDGKDGNYFVCNISWEALPQYMVEQSVIEEAQNGGIENAAFLREYGARFVDGSDSYFSAKKMHEQTIIDGQKPNVLIQGNPSKKYILSIDPSWSSSPSSDYFAMCVGEINEETDSITVVHNYAVAGSELKEHIKYYFYLLNAFNIEVIVADNSDGNFIKAANESTLFQDAKLDISEFEYDGDLINQDYTDMIKKAKRDYSKMSSKICFKRAFSSETNRRMNEQLQFFINTKKVWFGSKITPNDDEYDKAIKLKIPYDPTNKHGDWQDDLISTQDSLIGEVKKQCSLIEVGSSPLGKQTFDLPQSLKRNRSAGRARKDNYTTLLLMCEGFQAYQNIMKQPAQEAVGLFMPRMVGRSTLG